MKKLAIMAALAISVLTFNPVEASTVSVDNPEVSEMSHWTQFRDSLFGRRHKDRDRYDDRYDRRGRYDDRRFNDRYDDRRGHRPPPPPPRHRW